MITKRKSICAVLTALLFTAFATSCQKGSSPLNEDPVQVQGVVAVQAEEPGSAVKNSRMAATLLEGPLDPVPIYEYYNSGCSCRALSTNTSITGWTRIGASFAGYLNNISHLSTIPIYEYALYNPNLADVTYSPNPNDPNILSFPGWQLNSSTPKFYVYSHSGVVGSIPVYRYYNSSESSTLFTSNSTIHIDYPGWVSNGIAWYAAAP